MKLYTFFRSSAAYRVRIALNLKGLTYEQVPVHLTRNGGEQRTDAYRQINPNALVPSLEDGGAVINQSLAIVEYLDEAYPQVPLLPGSAADRAHLRAIALTIACDIHPLQNLRVLTYLSREFQVDEEKRNVWFRHWVKNGLEAVERMVARGKPGKFAVGDTPTLADIFIVPQLANARRVNTDLSGMPTLLRIDENCQALPAFQQAAPKAQPDAE